MTYRPTVIEPGKAGHGGGRLVIPATAWLLVWYITLLNCFYKKTSIQHSINMYKQKSRAVAGNPRDAAVIFDP